MKKLITFYTQAGAIRFEKRLRKDGISCLLKPVPRKLSSSCGLCVEVIIDEDKYFDNDEIESCYEIFENDYRLIFTNEV